MTQLRRLRPPIRDRQPCSTQGTLPGFCGVARCMVNGATGLQPIARRPFGLLRRSASA